jgi:hypothetical protein
MNMVGFDPVINWNSVIALAGFLLTIVVNALMVGKYMGGVQLHALAYNLGNFLRTLATPEPIKDWSLTTLKDKLIKIGAKVVSHGRYVIFQMEEVAIARQMFKRFCGSSRSYGRSHHQR